VARATRRHHLCGRRAVDDSVGPPSGSVTSNYFVSGTTEGDHTPRATARIAIHWFSRSGRRIGRIDGEQKHKEVRRQF
jgi:hypothetical protein